ncbi:MAG: CinA family nicotinamide mononucleotide deamidase-related protein [Verrucomicrobiales bacterium]
MRIDLINTGTELLLGQTLNTHAHWLGGELFKLGLRIQRQVGIPDGDEIRLALLESIPRSDVVLVTGGLGPTSDDITREITADLLGLPLAEEVGVLDHIRAYLARRSRELNANSYRQAQVPRGARVLPNPFGTAPGLHIPPQAIAIAGVSRTPHLFLLPGPPRELYPMWNDHVVPMLRGMMETEPPQLRNFKLFGLGEAQVAETLEHPLLATGIAELGYCVRPGEVILRAIGSPAALDACGTLVRGAYGDRLFSETDELMEEVVVRLLRERGESVATAESCTGGLIAHRLTNVPGASHVFGWGFVTYANEAKTGAIGVPAALIEKHGAVSEVVARAMAEGALHASGAHHAVAVTGIAGPDGGTAVKPVGTVWIALASTRRTIGSPPAESAAERNPVPHLIALREFFPFDREMFKTMTSQAVLDLLRRHLLKAEVR